MHLLEQPEAQDPVNSRPVTPVKTLTSEDPPLVTERVEAADTGRLDLAFDLARQAEVNGRDTRWGLFDDTPESVLKDVLKARGRLDRQKAERLVSAARRLYEKRTGTDELRAANLDKARHVLGGALTCKARRACGISATSRNR